MLYIPTPFHNGVGVAFGFAITACLVAAAASALTGKRAPATDAPEPLSTELAAVAAEGVFEPSELVVPNAPEETTEPLGPQ